MTDHDLLQLARQAREQAYAPYSGFTVGAALLCDDGTVFTGCNMENASYTPTLCAERVAFAKAVSEGHRQFAAIAVAAGTAPCFPCGVCRQVMAEFGSGDFRIVLEGADKQPVVYTLADLLPHSFSLA